MRDKPAPLLCADRVFLLLFSLTLTFCELDIVCLNEWQDLEPPPSALVGGYIRMPVLVAGRGVPDPTASREIPVLVMMVVKCQTDLLQMIGTLCSPCRFASLLNRRQQQTHQDGNDCIPPAAQSVQNRFAALRVLYPSNGGYLQNGVSLECSVQWHRHKRATESWRQNESVSDQVKGLPDGITPHSITRIAVVGGLLCFLLVPVRKRAMIRILCSGTSGCSGSHQDASAELRRACRGAIR